MRAYRSATIALSAVLSHQNIKGGARSRRCIDFSLPFLSPVSSFFFLSSPSLHFHCGDVFLHAAREGGRKKGGKGVPPSIDRASLFRRSISNPPLFLPLSRVLPGRRGRGSTFDQAAAWISLMNLESGRQGRFWNKLIVFSFLFLICPTIRDTYFLRYICIDIESEFGKRACFSLGFLIKGK